MQEFNDFFMQNKILVLIWLGVTVTLIVTIFKSLTAKYKVIDPNKLTFLMNREQGVVVDLRSKEEFARGHITDSINLLPADIKEGNFGVIESKKSNPIILVCKTSQTAQANAAAFVAAGFENVSVLKDGLISWNEGSLPLVSDKQTKASKKKAKKATQA